MPEHPLAGRRFLVVEDEYMIASDLIASLEQAGAAVFGPVSDLERAMEIVGANFPLDGAVLDINLHGKMVYPAARLLSEKGVPIVFVTGYECHSIPSSFAEAPCLNKPIDERDLINLLATSACRAHC